MKLLFILCCMVVCLTATAQRQKELGLAVTNSNSAYPFSTFGGLLQSPLHAGVELEYGFNWKTKPHHHWYQQVKLGYFYHRFVQHGISLYTNIGYRYKFTNRFFTEAALGAGYLQSIPATAHFRLGDGGEYLRIRNVGRAQAIVMFNLGAGYTFNPTSNKPISVVATYQQRIQTPFVKSYVPLLPYNSLMIGVKIGIHEK